jgi:hypothetical protein
VPSNKGMNLTIRRVIKGRYPLLLVFIYSRLAGYAQRWTDLE